MFFENSVHVCLRRINDFRDRPVQSEEASSTSKPAQDQLPQASSSELPRGVARFVFDFEPMVKSAPDKYNSRKSVSAKVYEGDFWRM